MQCEFAVVVPIEGGILSEIASRWPFILSVPKWICCYLVSVYILVYSSTLVIYETLLPKLTNSEYIGTFYFMQSLSVICSAALFKCRPSRPMNASTSNSDQTTDDVYRKNILIG